jgi:AraC-like DNA-binding protein
VPAREVENESDEPLNSHLHLIRDWEARAAEVRFHAEQLASLSKCSLRQLERFFREKYRMSPQKWLDREQMRIAKGLLLEGMRVQDVADKVGFNHQSHFSRKFRQHFRLSPREFQTKGE